jgi:WD40 repeat protein
VIAGHVNNICFSPDGALLASGADDGVVRIWDASSGAFTLRARWVTLRARWVTLRARWVTLRARWVMLGDAKSSLGDVQARACPW